LAPVFFISNFSDCRLHPQSSFSTTEGMFQIRDFCVVFVSL
jgi:hypothetical protein